MKKKVLIILICVAILLVAGCSAKEESDALKFKKEYEALNGVENDNGKIIRTLDISSDNPFVYQTAEEIVERMDNSESFVVYFGFAKCPWCRSMLEQLISSAQDHNIKTIYYVDVLEIRDIYEYKEGELKRTKEGTKGYNDLIEKMAEVLSDYTLTVDEEVLEVGEKRIYAPNVVAVVDGKATKMVEGISSLLTDPYMELTEEIKKESYDSFECLWKCLVEESTVCQKNAC